MARVVQLSEVLEKQRINNAVTHVWQYVPSGIVTQDVLDNVEKAKQPLVKIYYYHNNHLGTPQELTDSDGDVVWLSYDYSWGGQFDRHYKPQQVGNYDVSESELQPIKFQGQSLDVETGLHYNRFRYYDSDVGMFISRDPIGLLGGSNVFQYAPNPVGWIDPWGLSCTKPQTINPKDIRFSQSSVNGAGELVESMNKNGWKGDPIDVVKMKDGGLTTLDNTRVLAASRANINVEANVRNYSDPLPKDMIERFTTKKGVPSTWGEAVDLRIGKQSAGWRNGQPNGKILSSID